MALLYILKSKKDGSYYIGSTNNIENRLLDHNFRSTNKYTCRKRPWEPVFLKEYKTLTEVIKEEKRLKSCKNKRYLEWIINKQSVHSSMDRATPF